MGRKEELLKRISRLMEELDEAEKEIKDLPNIDMKEENIEFSVSKECIYKVCHVNDYNYSINIEDLRKNGQEFGEWMMKHSSRAFMEGLAKYLQKYNLC